MGIYHHGEISKYEIRELTSIKINFNNFTDDDTKTKVANITEYDKISLLTRAFDNDHNEVFTIYRGLVKEISTVAVRYNMSKEQSMECILICMDCSTENNSDMQYIKLCSVVEVNDINHEYEEIKNSDIQVIEHDPEWISNSNEKETEIDIGSRIELSE